MSARGDIFRIAGLNDQSSRYFEMRKALDAYTHELAEVIRDHGSHGEPGFGRWNCDFSGCQELADLIDPECP